MTPTQIIARMATMPEGQWEGFLRTLTPRQLIAAERTIAPLAARSDRMGLGELGFLKKIGRAISRAAKAVLPVARDLLLGPGQPQIVVAPAQAPTPPPPAQQQLITPQLALIGGGILLVVLLMGRR